MAGIEAFLSLTVAALHLAVVPWCVRSDQLMPDAQLRGSFLKQCRQVTPAIGETVGEFKPIVSLNALYLYSSGSTTPAACAGNPPKNRWIAPDKLPGIHRWRCIGTGAAPDPR